MKRRLTAIVMAAVLMVSALTGCAKGKDASSSDTSIPNGVYEGIGNGFKSEVKVSVKIEEGKIAEVVVLESNDTPGISDPAVSDIPKAIVEAQSTEVEAVSGATLTSKGIMEAVQNALDTAMGVEKEEVKLLENPDVLVAGGGLAGMISAIEAAENGAKVILFEKTGALGGTFGGSTLSGAGTTIQAENGITDDSADKFFADFIRLNENYQELNPGVEYDWNEDLGRYYAENSGPAVEWYDELGVTFKERVPSQPTLYQPLNTPRVYIGDRASMEEKVEELLQKYVDEGKISVALNTPVKELIMEGKDVAGVVVEKKDGTTAEYRAAATILATGGYAHSQEIVEEYNKLENFTTTAPDFCTGDGHVMAQQAGAELTNMDFITVYAGGLKTPETGLTKTLSIRVKDFPHIIFVNKDGQRFVDELGNEDGSDYDEITSWWKKNDNKVYIMLDQAMVDGLKAQGVSIISGDKDWSKFDDQLAKGNVLFSGSTIEEVAEKAGINGENLAATIERYNGFAQNGVDEDFGRTRLMTEFTGGTYYIFETTPYLMLTAGGPAMNDNGEVLNANGDAIPGLYQAGEIVGIANAFGRTTVGGVGNTGNIVWGKLAGGSAAKYALNKK